MFTERLNLMIKTLEASVPELAGIIGYDRSNLDRFVAGTRIPRRIGKSARHLVSAIYTFAIAHGCTDQLFSLISCAHPESSEQVENDLLAWLYEDDPVTAISQNTEQHAPYEYFGKKFSAIMDLTGMSNIRLGRLLHVDASYISRFRNGSRSPFSNYELAKSLCEILLNRLTEQNKLSELAELMQISPNLLADSSDALRQFRNWLYDFDKNVELPFVSELLDKIGSLSGDIPKPLFPFEEATDSEVLSSCDKIYYGVEGLQDAVIRFLGNCILRNEKELFLYSDQNMEWMVSEPIFHAKWASLMILAIRNGIRINIIHNINRGLVEMREAINSWIPLYPSGLIRSWYCKTPNHPRFSTTLFLCPGYACISGSNIIGCENELGIYRFDTEPELLAAHYAAYNRLLKCSGTLSKVYPGTAPELSVPESSASYYELNDTLLADIMPEMPLKNIHLIISANRVSVTRTSEPFFSIAFEHPEFCRTFVDYATHFHLPPRSN